MTTGLLAVFGLSGGELLLVLAVLAIGGLLLVGAATTAGYFVIRMLSRKSKPSQCPAVGSTGK